MLQHVSHKFQVLTPAYNMYMLEFKFGLEGSNISLYAVMVLVSKSRILKENDIPDMVFIREIELFIVHLSTKESQI